MKCMHAVAFKSVVGFSSFLRFQQSHSQGYGSGINSCWHTLAPNSFLHTSGQYCFPPRQPPKKASKAKAAMTAKPTSRPSVSTEEVQRFKELSQSWWDMDGSFSVLHRYNPVRLQFIKDILGSSRATSTGPMIFQDKRFLDVGCGGGILSEPLSRLGGHTVGIDATDEAIQVAQHHWEATESSHTDAASIRYSLAYRNVTTETIIEEGLTFDAVIASEVIEHVTDPSDFFNQLVQCTKPGGFIFVTTINRTIDSYLLAILMAENVLKIAPKGIHSWDKFVTPAELTKFAKSNNVEHIRTQGVAYLPLLKRFVHEPFARVLYMAAFKKSV